MAGRPKKHKPISEEAFNFIMALRGDRGVFISAIYHKSGEELSEQKPYNCYIEYEDLAMGNADITEITRLNEKEKYEVFLLINHSTISEPRKNGSRVVDKHIDEIIAQFVDFDFAIQPNWDNDTKIRNIQEFKSKVKTLITGLSLKPSIVVETYKGYHIYFKVRPAEGQTNLDMKDKFRYIQEGFIEQFQEYGADRIIKEPRRVMRLPGFYHNKDKNNPIPINMVSCNPDIIYTQDDIIDAFKITPPQIDERKTMIGTSGLVSTTDVSKTELNYLFKKCEFIKQNYKNPDDMGYNVWFGIGSNLCRCGTEGEALWLNMSRRDKSHFYEGNFPNYYDKVKNYICGCELLGCDKYRSYQKRKVNNPKVQAPCGVGVPYDLFLKENEIRKRDKKLDYSSTTEIDVNEAAIILREQIQRVLEDGQSGIYLFNGPFGLGKSRITLSEVVKYKAVQKYKKILWLGATHEQVDEMEHEIYDIENEIWGTTSANITHLKGLNKFPGFRCYYQRNKDLSAAMGFKLGTSYCSICHYIVKEKCPYFQQWKEAFKNELIFGVHEHLASLDKINPKLLILDENFLKANELFFHKEDVNFSIDLLKQISENVQQDVIEFFVPFLQKVGSASSTSRLFDIFTNEFLNKFRSFPSSTIDTLNDECFYILKIKKRDKQIPDDIRFVLADVMYWLEQAVNSNGSVDSALRKIGLAAMEENIYLGQGNSKDEFRYSYSKITPLPTDCTTIILDATGSKEFYEKALHRPVTAYNFDGYHIKQKSKMILVNQAHYYMSSIVGNVGGPKETQDKAIGIIKDLIKQGGYKNPGIITFKKLEKRVKKEFEGCVQDHFGNLRGKNTFRSCDAIFILGFLRYPATTIAKRAYQLFAMDVDIKKLINVCRTDYNGLNIDLKAPLRNLDDNVMVHKQLFHFEELALVFDVYCYGELLQAIGRARIYDEHREQTVYVMTDCECSGFFIYDEVYKHPTKLDQNKLTKAEDDNDKFIVLLQLAYAEGVLVKGKKPAGSRLYELAKDKNISISRKVIYDYVNMKRPWPDAAKQLT